MDVFLGMLLQRQSLLALCSYFLSDVFPQLLSATSMHPSYFSLVEIQIGMDATIHEPHPLKLDIEQRLFLSVLLRC
jgi:hypothetical protein